ncbi:MAG: hypothetical protein M1508_14735 [Nitrospirae bacterium]|nr:hypothetical protein [Nitrospirota bacterium]MCL5422272.1 hypothetical protein [Nitrospirota bacterium]
MALPTVIKCRNDTGLVESPLNGNAYVTGDRGMLDLKDYFGKRVISLKEYLSS